MGNALVNAGEMSDFYLRRATAPGPSPTGPACPPEARPFVPWFDEKAGSRNFVLLRERDWPAAPASTHSVEVVMTQAP